MGKGKFLVFSAIASLGLAACGGGNGGGGGGNEEGGSEAGR